MFIVEAEEVEKRLTMEICMDLMRKALSEFESGLVVQPMRSIHQFPGEHKFGFMPACLGDGRYFGAKVINACHKNLGTAYPSHAGYVFMFDGEHGMPLGLVDAMTITKIRTGAVSGVATDLLARKDAKVLALIGAGAQAYSHARAILHVRQITEIRIYDINEGSSHRFAQELSASDDVRVRVCSNVQGAVKDADIICTLTPSTEPYLRKEWVRKGAHINAVGAFTPVTREITSELMAEVKLYADSKESMMRECGEYLIPCQEGLFGEEHIAGTIGGLLNQTCAGRISDDEITLFDALGLAVEDVTCGRYFCS